MKTLELEIKVMQYFGVQENVVVPNVYNGIGLNYEADIVVLNKSNYATEIEIKTSKADLMKDKEKKNYHNSNLFKYLFFAVPENLKEIALKEIPVSAGLFLIRKNTEIKKNGIVYYKEIIVSREAVKNEACLKWSDEQRNNLMRLGTMRILGLKQKVLREQQK